MLSCHLLTKEFVILVDDIFTYKQCGSTCLVRLYVILEPQSMMLRCWKLGIIVNGTICSFTDVTIRVVNDTFEKYCRYRYQFTKKIITNIEVKYHRYCCVYDVNVTSDIRWRIGGTLLPLPGTAITVKKPSIGGTLLPLPGTAITIKKPSYGQMVWSTTTFQQVCDAIYGFELIIG